MRYFLLLHRKVSHQAGYFLACIGPMDFEQKCQEPRYSSIAKRLDIREEHFRNHMRHAHHQIHASLTQPSSRDCNVRIHAVAFDLSSIHAASFKPLNPLSRASTSSYSRRCTNAAAPGRCYATRKTLCERSRRTHEMESRCRDFCNIVYTLHLVELQPSCIGIG